MRTRTGTCLPLLLLILIAPVEAEIVCTGFECDRIHREYGVYFEDFEKKYVPALTRDILLAHSIAAAAGIPGPVNLSSIAIGAYATLGFTPITKVELSGAQARERQIKERGMALQPNLSIGINLGWLVSGVVNIYGRWFTCDDAACAPYISFPLLDRVDLYAYGVGAYKNGNASDAKTGWKKSRTQATSLGFAVRFHLLNQTDLIGPFFQFSGLSLGAGRFKSNQRLLLVLDRDIAFDGLQFGEYAFIGTNQLESIVITRTDYADLRTGFSLLRVLHVYAGIGVSQTRGQSHISYHGEAAISQPERETHVTVNFEGMTQRTIRTGFILGGVGLGPLTIQGTRSLKKNSLSGKHVYAASIGFIHSF